MGKTQCAAIPGGAAKLILFCGIPKKLITFNPMQYVKLRGRKEETDISSGSEEDIAPIPMDYTRGMTHFNKICPA